MATSRVFISYSSADSGFAQHLRAELQQRGVQVWLDQDTLLPGDDWKQSIDQGISSSDSIIVVLSPNSSESSYVTYEWAYAQGRGANVIPILLKPCSIHRKLDSVHYLDFTDARHRDWDTLARVVGRRRTAEPIFSAQWPDVYLKDLEEAQELLLVGVSLRDTLKDLGPLLKRKLDRTHQLRFLLAEPSQTAVDPAVRRTCTECTEEEVKAASKAKCAEIEETRRRILKFRDGYRPGQVQLRTTNYPLGYGASAVNPHIDASGRASALYIKWYPYKAEVLGKPRFVLRSGQDQWYESFHRELMALWQDGQEAVGNNARITT